MSLSIQPTSEVDYRQAERILELWLKTQGMGIMNCQEWSRWHYNNRPFWSVWGLVGTNTGSTNFCGIHIYDDGDVVIVAKDIWTDTDFQKIESGGI